MKIKLRKVKSEKKISDKVLDDLQRTYIRLISGGYCKRCKKKRYIEVAHMYKRARKTTRWDYRNVYALCPECHRLVDNDSIVKASFMYDVMISDEIEELQRLANLTIKDSPIDREEIKSELKAKIKILEKGE